MSVGLAVNSRSGELDFADVLGQEIAVFQDAEQLAAMAVASAALLGLGRIESYEQFTTALGGTERCVHYAPRPELTAAYAPLYGKFCRLHPALRDLW